METKKKEKDYGLAGVVLIYIILYWYVTNPIIKASLIIDIV